MTNRSRKIPTKEKMKREEKIIFIEEKTKAGYTPYEIVESDTTKSIALYEVFNQIQKMLEEGRISQEEIDASRQKRYKGKKSQTHKEVVEIIKEYTRLGYSYREIAEALDYNYSQLIAIKNEDAVPNGWFTKEEIREFKKQREAREYEALPQEEKDRIEREKQEQEARAEQERQQKRMEKSSQYQKRRAKTLESHQKDIEKIKQYIARGYTIAETAELLGMEKGYIYTLRRESQANGTWFSPEEIEELRQNGVDIALKEVRRK